MDGSLCLLIKCRCLRPNSGDIREDFGAGSDIACAVKLYLRVNRQEMCESRLRLHIIRTHLNCWAQILGSW